MGLLALQAKQIFTPLEALADGVILIEDETIRAVGPRQELTLPSGVRVVDLGERIIAPGMVDVHIHGGAGSDVMEATPEALDAVSKHLLEGGTTSFLPTTLTAPLEKLKRSAGDLRSVIGKWREVNGGPRAEPLGIHLEGPFLSPDCRGAHTEAHLLVPSITLFDQIYDAGGEALKILTMAPELPGAPELQAHAAARGLRVAIGHSNATYEEARRAIDAGAGHAVHVFNAMRRFTHRDPGILGAVLTDDRVMAEVIADGVHVSAPALELLVRAKGVANTVLVTDAVSATGMSPGRYRLGEMEIVLEDDPVTGLLSCRNGEGVLAGSVLTLDRAVRNMISMAGVGLRDAVRMATWNPARLVGLEGRKGVLRAGADADLMLLHRDGTLAGAMARGRANFL